MSKRTLTVAGTSTEELAGMIKEVVGNEFKEKEDSDRKKEHINKALKKDEMIAKKEVKKHVHSCPSCQATLEKLGDGYEYCKDCGTTDLTLKKGQKLLICSNCGTVVSESVSSCPNCGSTKAHWAK